MNNKKYIPQDNFYQRHGTGNHGFIWSGGSDNCIWLYEPNVPVREKYREPVASDRAHSSD